MRMYIGALPRMQALRIGCVLFAALLSVPFSAQNARTQQNAQIHSNGSQANLRIEANVVPAIGAHHHHKDKDKNGGQEEDAVSYILNPQYAEFSVSEETRPMQVDSGNGTVRQEQVRTITIAPK